MRASMKSKSRIKHKLKLTLKRRKKEEEEEKKEEKKKDGVPVIPTVEELDALSAVSLEGWISISSASFTPDRYADIKVEEKGERRVEVVSKEDIDPLV